MDMHTIFNSFLNSWYTRTVKNRKKTLSIIFLFVKHREFLLSELDSLDLEFWMLRSDVSENTVAKCSTIIAIWTSKSRWFAARVSHVIDDTAFTRVTMSASQTFVSLPYDSMILIQSFKIPVIFRLVSAAVICNNNLQSLAILFVIKNKLK